MPRCFPPDPDFPEDRRAERVVWEALRDQLPDDAALFHSVCLLEGKKEREIDLLVAWPGVGLAAIEVKGGHVTVEAGQWYQSGRDGKHRVDPVTQVQDGKKILLRYLVRQGCQAGYSPAAHLVAVPVTAVAAGWEAPDCPRTALIDRTEVRSAAARVRAAIQRHGHGNGSLDAAAVEALVTVLATTMSGQLSLLSDAEEHEQRVDQMTRDQYKTLQNLKYHRRLKVIGGAGTGKTWLALEQARRLAADGERVALVCYSRGLARWFRRMTDAWQPRERPAYVGLFHELPVTWGAAPAAEDSDDFEVRLPRELGELAAARPAKDRFDSVVVDEAQDFGELWWPSLLACLREPVDGKLFVFLDEAQHVFARRGDVPIALPPYVLTENMRNTKQIAQLFGSLSGEKVVPRGLPGPPVRLVECPADAAVGRADDAVEALLDEGWSAGQIALLTTRQRHPEQRNTVEVGGWAAYWDGFFAEKDVFYGHVLGFKGLERPVVVLAVNGYRDAERAREMLYVGLSRARTLLVLVGERAVLESVGGGGVRERLRGAQEWDPA